MDKGKALRSDYIQNQSSRHDGPPSNHIMRNTMRRVAHREYKNEIYTTLMSMRLEYLFSPGKYEWLEEFIDLSRNYEHPLFNELIKSKLEQYPLSERTKHVDTTLRSLSYSEVAEFCYGMKSEAVNYIATHSEEIIRKQEHVKLTAQERLNELNKLSSLQNTIIADETADLDEYLAEGGELNHPIEPDVIQPPKSQGEDFLKNLISQLAPVEKGEVLYDNRKEKIGVRPATLAEVKENNVFVLSEKFPDKAFPVMFYAPPNSGKSTYNKKVRQYSDTDSMYLWQLFESNGLYMTNMPHLLEKANFRIALIPDRDTFETRCLMRGLFPTKDWYSGMIRQTNSADCKILSNKLLTQLACIGS